MKRDFTDDNFNQIKQYLNDADDENKVWDNVITFFVAGLIPSISSFFTKLISSIVSLFIRNDNEPSGEELKWYYNHVVEENEKLRHCLKQVFDKANGADAQYAQRGEKLLSSGREILKELEYLIEIATPNSISNIAKSKAPNIIISSILDETSAITDEDLIAFCKGDVKVDFWSLLTEANQAILDVDGMDMFLVILFNYKDIAVDAIVAELNKEGNSKLKSWISDNILNGSEKFVSVQEIAERVGCSQEVVRQYLISGSITTIDLGYGKIEIGNPKFGDGNLMEVEADLKRISSEIDTILAQQLKDVTSDKEYLQEYCDEFNLDIKQVEAVLSEEFSAYEKELYLKNIAPIIEEVGGYIEHKEEFDLHLSDAKNMIKSFNTNKKFLEKTTDAGKLWDEVYKKDKYDDEKIRELLEKHCGYKDVSAKDINIFKGLHSNIEGLGGVAKVFTRGQEISDALAYMTADFSQEISVVDKLIECADPENNPSYVVALNELKDGYENQYRKVLVDTQIESFEKMLINEGIDAVLNKVPAVGIVETATKLVGEATGANDYTGTIVDLMAYPGMTSQILETYNASVEAVAGGDPSAIESVRVNFVTLKQTLSSYYDKCEVYYEGMKGDVKANLQRSAYAGYMKDQIDNMELGEPFKVLSFNQYIEQNSIQ